MSKTLETTRGHLSLFAARGGLIGVQAEAQLELSSVVAQCVLNRAQAVELALELLGRATDPPFAAGIRRQLRDVFGVELAGEAPE